MRLLAIIVLMMGCAADDGGGGGGGGGEGGSELSGTCDLGASTSGAIVWTIGDTPACLIPFGGDTGIWMVYRPLGEQVVSYEVDVTEIQEGQTGEFPARVTVRIDQSTSWVSTMCSVILTEHVFTGEMDELSRTYQAVGTGQCATPATSTASQETVVIEPFAFRFPAHW